MEDLSEVHRQAERLADRLLEDLHSRRLAKIGIDEIEAAAQTVVAQSMDPELYRELVNLTESYLSDKAAKMD